MPTSVTQSVACKTRAKGRDAVFKKLSKCHACEDSRSSAATCRFVGKSFLLFHYSFIMLSASRTVTIGDDLGENFVAFHYKDGPPPHYPQVFNRKFTLEDIQLKRVRCEDIHRSPISK